MQRYLILVLAFLLSTPAAAGEVHHGDIEPRLNLATGQIVLNNDVEIDAATGFKLFESDFREGIGSPYETDEPGFDHETGGEFAPEQVLWYRVTDHLQYWDGSSWSYSVPNGETLRILDALGNSTTVGTSTINNPEGAVGQFDGDGHLHQHLDFFLQPDGSAAVGAYLLQIQLFATLSDLSTPVHQASEPFFIAFNGGLDEAAFEASVESRVVPIPAGIWLMLSALATGLGIGRRTTNRRL